MLVHIPVSKRSADDLKAKLADIAVEFPDGYTIEYVKATKTTAGGSETWRITLNVRPTIAPTDN